MDGPRLHHPIQESKDTGGLDPQPACQRHIEPPSAPHEAERTHLVHYVGRYGFHSVPASALKTCTVRFDNNKYAVLATAAGRPVEVHAYAECIVIRRDGVVLGEHARAFGRGQTVYDPCHYVPVLARKLGALLNGAPFKD
jgi:hypothetical protein